MARKSAQSWWSMYGFIFLVALAAIFLLFVAFLGKTYLGG